MKYSEQDQVKDVVTDDFRAAAIFQKVGMDFCCGGAVPIGEACVAKGVDSEILLRDLNELGATSDPRTPRFNTWGADMLSSYIIVNHHSYIRDVTPVIAQHAEKVAKVHGGHSPHLVRVAEIFAQVSADMSAHMAKEENVLFPYIVSIARSRANGYDCAPAPFGTVVNPIRMMEAEHQAAGDEMQEIRMLTNNYTPPPEACATYRVLFQELEAFENDLHMHVHLENNILFPKAVALENPSYAELAS